MYKLTNSHAASCDYYNYKVCCDEISVATKSECDTNEGTMISFFQPNNTHVAKPENYPYKLCGKYSEYPLECAIRDSCYVNETCVISLFALTNSHVAECTYYTKKLCCAKLSDLYVNSSSISPNVSSPTIGETVEFNLTIWNIGDAAAPNVNVSCYANSTYFDSNIINSIPPDPSMQTPRYATCYWQASCKNNISIKVDPANEIKELNESNNEAWKIISIIEKLNITIISPQEGGSFYRGQTIELNSTVSTSCNPSSTGHEVKWYNETTLIGSGDNITWSIPLDDALLGTKTINATVTKAGYVSDSDLKHITILNNLPQLTTPAYNVTPPEVESGDGIEISCDITDLEDGADYLNVNISILNPNGKWDNATALHIGNTFYREFKAPNSPLGNYTAYCVALDSDNGYNESLPSKFLVYQNGTVVLSLNVTEVWWNDPVEISGTGKRGDGTALSYTDVSVLVEGKNVCPLAATDANGFFSCWFRAPQSIGIYDILVKITDPQTGKIITNTTQLNVKIGYGGTKEEEQAARSVGCFEVPKIIQNPDGTIERVKVRVCVWR
jgi:hypothetical protein